MRIEIGQCIHQSLETLRQQGLSIEDVEPQLTPTKDETHGDFASNIALLLAKSCGLPPRELAQKIVANLPSSDLIRKVEIAGPGFINFHLTAAVANRIVETIVRAGGKFGHKVRKDKKPLRALVEYVSANPTGPLHVGHGRGAAYGASIAAMMRATGMEVDCEYYVNDAGRQMDILALSVWLRYLSLGGASDEAESPVEFPPNAYQGDYIWDIAAVVRNRHGGAMEDDAAALFADLQSGDAEKDLDRMIQKCRQALGENYDVLKGVAIDAILGDIRRDLAALNVNYNRWFSEKALLDSGQIETAVGLLRKNGFLYEDEGALWFRSSSLGDDKDRVVRRENGQWTYFASDIAYHYNKYQRGYDRIINIWGADHHGYVPRVQAAIKALGLDADKLTIVLVQFANLYRGGQKVSMSTRAAEYITLRELYQEVGVDATRFFYVMHRPSQHMDFDVDLAKAQTNDNPVYYIQYVHARICSVFRQLKDRSLAFDAAKAAPDILTEAEEAELIKLMTAHEEVLHKASEQYKPHLLLNHLRDLATKFHSYYNNCMFLVEDETLRNSRLLLLEAVRFLIADGLELIGVAAPEKM